MYSCLVMFIYLIADVFIPLWYYSCQRRGYGVHLWTQSPTVMKDGAWITFKCDFSIATHLWNVNWQCLEMLADEGWVRPWFCKYLHECLYLNKWVVSLSSVGTTHVPKWSMCISISRIRALVWKFQNYTVLKLMSNECIMMWFMTIDSTTYSCPVEFGLIIFLTCFNFH